MRYRESLRERDRLPIEVGAWVDHVVSRGAWPPRSLWERRLYPTEHDRECDCVDCLGRLGVLPTGGAW